MDVPSLKNQFNILFRLQIGNDEIELGLLTASPHALYDEALDKGREGSKTAPKLGHHLWMSP